MAEAGAGIAMSFLLKPQIEAQNSSMLTLVTALAVNEAICETTGIRAKIKWPNDIIVNGKKICGILTEMSLQMDEINYIVVGLGIITMKIFSKPFGMKAGCYFFFCQKIWFHHKFIAFICHRINLVTFCS